MPATFRPTPLPTIKLVLATTLISLFSSVQPVNAHDNSPLRARRNANQLNARANALSEQDFVRRHSPVEARELDERGLLGDVVGGVVTGVVAPVVTGVVGVVDTAVQGVTSVVGQIVTPVVNAVTSQPPANTPAPIPTTTPGGGNTPPTTNGNGPPGTTTQGSNPPANSPPSQQTSQTGSPTNAPNGGASNPGASSPTKLPGSGSSVDPSDTLFAQNAIANGGTRKTTLSVTRTYVSTRSDGVVETKFDVATQIVDLPNDQNGDGNSGSKGPNPAVIGGVVAIFILLLLLGIGIFIWRRRKRQPIVLTRSRPTSASSFGSASDEWAHVRDSTVGQTIGLGGSAASMGSGGMAEMSQRDSVLLSPANPTVYARQARLSISGAAGTSSSEGDSSPRESLATTNIHFPANQYPMLVNATLSDYPAPGTYTAFAIAPESSSEEHSAQRSASEQHYEASTETFGSPTTQSHSALGSPITPTAARTFHTGFREERREIRQSQRLSEYEVQAGPSQTPRASVDNPFSDNAEVVRQSVDSGRSLAIHYPRPQAPSPLVGIFGPTMEAKPSSPYLTGVEHDASTMRESYSTRRDSFATARSGNTNSTIRLSAPPTRIPRGSAVSVLSSSSDEFYSATSHAHETLDHSNNGQTSSSGHYITAPENPFADPHPDNSNSNSGESGETRYSTASANSASFAPQVIHHRGNAARAEVVASPLPLLPPRSPKRMSGRPLTGQSSSGQSIVSSVADQDAARCISPDENELFYRPLNFTREERPSEDTQVPEDYNPPVSNKAKRVLGTD